MNERLLQLSKQAQQYAEYTTPQGSEWFNAFKEKFAELLVRECQERVDQYIRDCGEIASLPDRVIKEHFGI